MPRLAPTYVIPSLLALLPSFAFGAEIAVEARIDEVKVYTEGATVGRHGQVSIPEGEHRLVIRGLPGTLDADTLRISVANSQVRLGAIELEKITTDNFVGAQERELRARLQQLQDQRDGIQDEIASAETQLKLLESLATAPGGNATRPAVDATNLGPMLTTIGTTSSTARTRIRDARIRTRELDTQIAKVNADLQKVATARKTTYEVRATVQSAAAVTPIVAVEYGVEDAEWRWVYEARLDTNNRRLGLGRQASVQQGTGEDWSNATLTLTTAHPTEDAATPQLASLFVDLEQELDKRAKAAIFGGAMAPPAELSEIVVTGQNRQRADVVATDYLADYRIAGRITLTSDNEPRLYPVAEDEFDVELLARVLPAVSRSAYLETSFTFKGDVPIQGGDLQLYRDGAFVGTAKIDSLLPGADVRVPFGTDDRIRVVVRNEAAQSGRQGIVSRQTLDDHRQRFEVTNYHASTIDVEVIDRVPVSENRDIRIEIGDGATKPSAKDFEGRAGVMLWKLAAKPRETATIRHYYSVNYPANRELASREEEP
jgi:uncharacterized protein (TIGR02231 family)